MSDIAQRKAELLAQLAELRGRHESLKIDASQEHSADSAERAQERENDEVVDAIGIETSEAIVAVTRALTRIEDGSYGACERCGNAIPPARLAVRPEASFCINCAD